MPEPDQMLVLNVGKWDIFSETCQYDEDKAADSQTQGQTALDSYDPVVEKWMTNLVATMPITVKAMQSLVAELNRQKKLKRTYRRRYKDLQTVATTTTNPSVKSQPPVVVTSNKTNASPPNLKTSLGQGKKIIGKGKKHQTSW